MKTDDNGHIESFVEKPHASELEQWASVTSEEMQQAGKIYLASMGIYIFNKKTLLRLFSENPEATDFGKEIIPKAIEDRSEEHTSELQSRGHLVCRLLLEKKK